MLTLADKGERGLGPPQILADTICEQPLITALDKIMNELNVLYIKLNVLRAKKDCRLLMFRLLPLRKAFSDHPKWESLCI